MRLLRNREVDEMRLSKRYSFSAVVSTSPKRMQIVSTSPALSKAPTVPLFYILPVKFPCIQQRNHLGDSFAGYMERQIIGIDFGSVGLLSNIMRGGVEHNNNTTTTANCNLLPKFWEFRRSVDRIFKNLLLLHCSCLQWLTFLTCFTVVSYFCFELNKSVFFFTLCYNRKKIVKI